MPWAEPLTGHGGGAARGRAGTLLPRAGRRGWPRGLSPCPPSCRGLCLCTPSGRYSGDGHSLPWAVLWARQSAPPARARLAAPGLRGGHARQPVGMPLKRVGSERSPALPGRAAGPGPSRGAGSAVCPAARSPSRSLRPALPVSPVPAQPASDASPMKRSISTLAPQRPHVAHLCTAALERAPASQAAPHHHHRCHRRRDRKQKSLEKGPSPSADTNGGACGAPWWAVADLGSASP